MRITLRCYLTVCFALSLVVMSLSAWMFSCEGFTRVKKLDADGEYLIHHQELVPRESIKAFVVGDGMIFLYFDDHALVNVYRIDGTFEYGIQVGTIPNGAGDIAYNDGKLYIWSHQSSVYVFQGQQLDQFMEPARNLETSLLHKSFFNEEADHSYDGTIYSVTDTLDGIINQMTTEPVIELPVRNKFAETLLVIWAVFIALAMYFYPKIVAP